VVTKCDQLKILSQDGKMRETDVVMWKHASTDSKKIDSKKEVG
jgi:hypothetical protein